MNAERTIRALADAEAIRDLARRYAHCVWQKDVAGAIDLFCEDAVMDTGDREPLRGRQQMLATYGSMFEEAELHPFVHNHVLEVSGDSARGTCYLDLRATLEGKRMTGFGYYEDEYVRVDGEWKFRSRKLEMCELVEAGGSGESTALSQRQP